MATAPIEVAIPGMTGLTLTVTLFPHGSDTAATGALSLTEATNRKCVYTTTTTAGLTGVHMAVVKESSTVRAIGFVYMDDTTSNHVVVGDPFTANVAATQVDASVSSLILTQSAAQVASILAGTTITVYRGTKWTIALTDIGSLTGYTKIYFTVRTKEESIDSKSMCQVRVSNPGVGTDGLLYFNGASATAAHGSLTVDDAPTGDITIVVEAAATQNAVCDDDYVYDIKLVTSSNVILRSAGGTFVIAPDVTRAIS